MNPDIKAYTSRQNFNNILLGFPSSGRFAELRNRAIMAENQGQVDSLLADIILQIDLCMDTQCKEDQNFYYLLRAYCNLWMGKSDEAVNAAKIAIDGFRMCADEQSQVFGHWFAGMIYALQRRGHLYFSEISEALEIMESIRNNHRRRGEYDTADDWLETISELETHKELASKLGTGPFYIPGQYISFFRQPASSPPISRLLLPWTPKYHSVRGGPGGLVWEKPIKEHSTYALNLEIDNKPLKLHPLTGTATSDHNITLSPEEEYGWVLVEGHSMNASRPAPICDGDYILFKVRNWAQQNDIVVASRPTADGAYSHMVKRFREPEKQLISETSDTSRPYPSLSVDQDYQILGVVIAVAKKEG